MEGNKINIFKINYWYPVTSFSLYFIMNVCFTLYISVSDIQSAEENFSHFSSNDYIYHLCWSFLYYSVHLEYLSCMLCKEEKVIIVKY